MERDVHGVTPGALDHPVQHALLDCHGNWIGVIGIDERRSSKYQSGWIRRMGLGGETESREEHADFRHMIGQAEFVTGGVLRVIRDVGHRESVVAQVLSQASRGGDGIVAGVANPPDCRPAQVP